MSREAGPLEAFVVANLKALAQDAKDERVRLDATIRIGDYILGDPRAKATPNRLAISFAMPQNAERSQEAKELFVEWAPVKEGE